MLVRKNLVWFADELAEAFPPAQLIRPGYAIGKEVCSLIWDIAAFVTPIILECAVELGSDLWRIATCEEAVHFYASVITSVVNFVQAFINFFKGIEEVKAAVFVYVASDSEKKESMQYLVCSFVFNAFINWFHNELNLFMEQIKESVGILKSGLCFIKGWIIDEIQVLKSTWMIVWS